jgi:catechol 2,3-dioxygenase-like lactoylglutathione lyase family enzyme
VPYRLSRLGYVEVRVLDLDDALKHYVDVLGLIPTGREGGELTSRAGMRSTPTRSS